MKLVSGRLSLMLAIRSPQERSPQDRSAHAPPQTCVGLGRARCMLLWLRGVHVLLDFGVWAGAHTMAFLAQQAKLGTGTDTSTTTTSQQQPSSQRCAAGEPHQGPGDHAVAGSADAASAHHTGAAAAAAEQDHDDEVNAPMPAAFLAPFLPVRAALPPHT